MAGEIDTIFVFWCAVLFLLVAPVFVFMTWCVVKYRAGRDVDRTHREARNTAVELSWTIIPLLISLVFFFWAGSIFLQQQVAPPNAMVVTAIGRQWMWKFQHPGGQSEINDLHVPVDQPIRIDIRIPGRHPFAVHPGPAHPAGSGAGTHHDAVVQGRPGRRLPTVLF